MDLARTLLDRMIEMRRQQMVQAYLDWKKGVTSADIVTDRAQGFVAAVEAMTRMLALHTDYSLWESYERLDAVEKIVNSEFDHVLVDNAVNSYCRSHQYEAAANWYEPLAKLIAHDICQKVATGEKNELDQEGYKKASMRMHDAMLTKPLYEMRPKVKRDIHAFRKILEGIKL